MWYRRHFTLVLVVSAGTVAAFGCSGDEVTFPGIDGDAVKRYRALIAEFELGPLPPIPYPDDNPFNAERIALGRLLFFDPILGGESAPAIKEAAGYDPYRFRANDVACATCHFPALGFADGRRLGAGVGGAQFRATDLGPDRVVPGYSIVTGEPLGIESRNTPTVLNTAFNGKNSNVPTAESFQFMDGRVTRGLEEQAHKPIASRDEMAGDAYADNSEVAALHSIPFRIRGIPEYVARFTQAFAGEVGAADHITIDIITRAIAAYERELITPGSRYDQFVDGDFDALTEQERTGFELFFGKALCGDCHNGPMLSDYTMRVQGVGEDYGAILPGYSGQNGTGGDFGRYHADTVAFADQKYAFRTLTVRNAEITAPYFHSGSAGSLYDALEFYNRGGKGPNDISDATLAAAGATRDPSIQPLGLTDEEIEAIVALIKTTTAPVQVGPLGTDLASVPQRVPSGLVPPGVPTPDGPGPFLNAQPEKGR